MLIAGVLLVSVAASLLLRQTQASTAVIYLDGILVERIVLSEVTVPYSFTVHASDGINVISVERGRICVSEADCPDKSCVRQGWVSGGAVPIVCLPHRLVIRLDNSMLPELDAIIG